MSRARKSLLLSVVAAAQASVKLSMLLTNSTYGIDLGGEARGIPSPELFYGRETSILTAISWSSYCPAGLRGGRHSTKRRGDG
jgi:hypothetical protein